MPVSKTIIKSYLKMGLPLKDIHEKVSVHINDTHPAVAPAEFMRLLLDEYGLSWEDAWNATVKTMSYTNHTILQEALEKWDQQLFKTCPSTCLPNHLGNRQPLHC